MPAFSSARAGSVTSTGDLVPIGAAGRQTAIRAMKYGGEDVGTTLSVQAPFLQRGTSSAGSIVTPEKLSSRSPAAVTTSRSITTFTPAGNRLLVVGDGPGHRIVSVWRPARPWATPIYTDVEAIGQTGSTRAHSQAILFDDDAFPKETLRPRRRPRDNGLWHVFSQDQNHGTSAASPVYDMKWRNTENYVSYIDRRWSRIMQNGVQLDVVTGPVLTPITLAGNLTLGLTMAKQIDRAAISASLVLTPVENRRVNQLTAVTLTMSPAMAKVMSRTFSAALTLTIAVQKLYPRSIAASLSLTLAVKKLITRLISTPVTLTAVLTSGRIKFLSIPSTLTLTASGTRVLKTTKAVTITFVLTVQRLPLRALSSSLVLTSTLAKAKAFLNLISATLTLTAAQTRSKLSRQALSASLSLSTGPGVLRRTQRAISGSLTLLVALNRRLNRPVPVNLTMTPAMTFQAGIKVKFVSITAGLVFSAVMTTRQMRVRALAASLVFNNLISRLPSRTYPVNLILQATQLRKNFRKQDASLTLTPNSVVTRRKAINVNLVLTEAISLGHKLFMFTLDATLTLATDLKTAITRFRGWISAAYARAKLFAASIATPDAQDGGMEEPEITSTELPKPKIRRVR
jgi:hypothetical protein